VTRAERALAILKRLRREYPEPRCALEHADPYQLLVATILSAQCTDERVNKVTPEVFRRWPTARELSRARGPEVERVIRSTGFFRNKTKSLLGASARITEVYGGEVPASMGDLLTLPGVARKTANVVLGTAYGRNEGVVVDTHVARLSLRMGLTRERDPEKIERDLMEVFPRREWTNLSHRLITHGRRVCVARLPRCAVCVVGKDLCPSFHTDPLVWKKRAAAAAGPPKGSRSPRTPPAPPSRKRRG
jgi:endonuclease-3